MVKVLNSGEGLNSAHFIELSIESMLCRYPGFHEGNGLVVAGLNASPATWTYSSISSFLLV